VDNRGQTVFPVCTAYRDPQDVMDEKGATEPEETGVFQGGLDLRDQLVSKERKEKREMLEFRARRSKRTARGER